MFNSVWNNGQWDRGSIKKGVTDFGDSISSFKQILEQRLINDGILSDGTDIWEKNLDSKTALLTGYSNRNLAFKIDHAFDLSLIKQATNFSNGMLEIDVHTYANSKGTEFIMILREDFPWANFGCAIRKDKYELISSEIKRYGHHGQAIFENAGGFVMYHNLTNRQVNSSDGWIELCVGKNNANESDYRDAKNFLEKYVNKAVYQNCFRREWADSYNPREWGSEYSTAGMQFKGPLSINDYRASLWRSNSVAYGSDADSRGYLNETGHFLR